MKLQSSVLQENIELLNDYLHTDDSFDLICRKIKIGDKDACLYFIDGFTNDELLQKLMQYFLDQKPNSMPNSCDAFSKQLLPYGETALLNDVQPISDSLLCGMTILLIDGFETAISIDCRNYPVRGVEEPEKDKVMRGSRDGFVETLIFNTALIRRRIRHPDLIMEHFSVGRSSKTDIILSYFRTRIDQKMLANFRKRISEIDIDSLTMNQESLVECLYTRPWINPFPKFKFTERPDTAASAILEGNLVILVDNSPSAIILPTSIFDIIEEADDYYFPPVTGTYLRLSRLIINIVALLLTPVFLLLMNHPQWIPECLSFITFQEDVNVHPFLQFFISQV